MFGDDEPESRDSLDALVGAAHDEIDVEPRHVDGDAAEAAHRVDDVDLPVFLDDPADRLDRVEHAGGRLGVDHGDVGDLPIRLEGCLQLLQVGRVDLSAVVGDAIDLQGPGDLHHPVAIGPVGKDQQSSPRRECRADGGLHTKRPAPLHEDAGISIALIHGQPDQLCPDVLHEFLVIVVPGAPIPEHGRLDGLGRGEWSGREQQIRVVR